MKRMTCFDGLRGLACLAVVAGHYESHFFPSVPWPPALDGQLAVALFFLMSGFVLTGAFKGGGYHHYLAARGIRLAVPAMFSVILAGAFLYIGHLLVPNVIKSLPSLAAFVADVSGKSIVFGYSGIGVFPVSSVKSLATSLNGPLWTINFEVWGSALVLAFVRLRDWARWAHGAAVLASVWLIGPSLLSLFTIGHLSALLVARPWMHRAQDATTLHVSGALTTAVGFVICAAPQFITARALSHTHLVLNTPIPCSAQMALAGTMIFAGVLTTPIIQRGLKARSLIYIGRLSFSLYLIHFPVLAVVGGGIFAALQPAGHAAALSIAVVSSLSTTFAVAIIFDRLIDRPVIEFSRRIKNLPSASSGLLKLPAE